MHASFSCRFRQRCRLLHTHALTVGCAYHATRRARRWTKGLLRDRAAGTDQGDQEGTRQAGQPGIFRSAEDTYHREHSAVGLDRFVSFDSVLEPLFAASVYNARVKEKEKKSGNSELLRSSLTSFLDTPQGGRPHEQPRRCNAGISRHLRSTRPTAWNVRPVLNLVPRKYSPRVRPGRDVGKLTCAASNRYVWGDSVHIAKTQCERYVQLNDRVLLPYLRRSDGL